LNGLFIGLQVTTILAGFFSCFEKTSFSLEVTMMRAGFFSRFERALDWFASDVDIDVY
jgi:hypothetical protein